MKRKDGPMEGVKGVTELSSKHVREGQPVKLEVNVRTALRDKLQKIAAREDRSLDYIVDELLRWAADQYTSASDLRRLLVADIDGENGGEEADDAELKRIQ